jgi:hypothetical protein
VLLDPCPPYGKLLALSDSELAIAKTADRHALSASLAGAVIGALAVVLSGTATYLLGIGALIAAAFAFFLNARARECQGRANRARRACQLGWALDASPPATVSALLSSFSRKAREKSAPPVDLDAYFATTQPPGPQRLFELIEENAFWTGALYRASAHRTQRWLVGYVAVLVIAAFAGLPATSDDDAATLVKMVVLALGLLLTTGQLARWRAWKGAAESLTDVTSWKAPETAAMVSQFAEYHAAIIGAPPISDKLFAARREQLEDDWRAVH